MNFGIVVAGGKSERMGPNVDKAFLSMGAQPVLAYSLQAFERCADIDGVVLVVRKERVEAARTMAQLFGCSKVTRVVAGGTTRQKSVYNGLMAMSDEVSIVAVHDGARPCVAPELISRTIKAARKFGCAVAAVKITDTIKEVQKGMTVTRSVDRSKLWAVQTPQCVKRELLLKGFARLAKRDTIVTDESSIIQMMGGQVRLVPSTWANIKITGPEDLAIASALLKS